MATSTDAQGSPLPEDPTLQELFQEFDRVYAESLTRTPVYPDPDHISTTDEWDRFNAPVEVTEGDPTLQELFQEFDRVYAESLTRC